MLFESHAHYDDEAFDEDRDELLSSLQQNGIGTVIDVGADRKSSEAALALSQRYPFVYAAIGVHPGETAGMDEETLEWLRAACAHPKVAAIGEIGLDYHWPEPSRDVQKRWFARQLALAGEAGLPVILHSRDAAQDTLDLVKTSRGSLRDALPGVVHCFSYTREIAREYLKLGFFFGIGGVITFSNAKKLREAVADLPLDHLLLETDSPYLAPEPFRGRRNCSLYLPAIAEKIAEIKRCSREEVIQVTEDNAKRLFFSGRKEEG